MRRGQMSPNVIFDRLNYLLCTITMQSTCKSCWYRTTKRSFVAAFLALTVCSHVVVVADCFSSNHRHGPLSTLTSLTSWKATNNSNGPSSDKESKSLLKRSLNRQFLSIAFPAFLQQAAVPIADLVDAAFLRRLGPSALGGVGVARASQAAVSKLYNSPLSKTTISLVASRYGATRGGENNSSKVQVENNADELSAAVSTGLLLALTVGLAQLLVFTLLAKPILGGMGITKTSDMAASAVSYMRARALSAPGATLWLVSNGIFRGLGDTKTPLYCSILLNIVNIGLDPILIRWGASGIALGTAISQAIALVPLLWILHQRVRFNIVKQLPDLIPSLKQYLEAGVFLLGRTVARVGAFAYCSRQSALLGSIAASAYSVTFQIGFVITLVCESISVAVQSLLSRELASTSRGDDMKRLAVSHLVRHGLLSGAIVTGILSFLVYVFQGNVVATLTQSPEIQHAALQAIPSFLLTQLIKGFSFPVNGIIMGGQDWRFSMVSMWFANAMCFSVLQVGHVTVSRIWLAWCAFMGSEAMLGLWRISQKMRRWNKLGKADPINEA